MTVTVHPSALVETGAEIGDGSVIGPFCVVGAKAKIGPGVMLKSHVVVDGRTTIGEKTTVFPFAAIGTQPQDLKFKGEESELFIGARCMIRENVTINPGTEGGGLVTRVGSNCSILAGAHVAHDCLIGNNVILVNNVLLGGHVEIGDYAIMGGGSAVHQFVRIGAHAMIGGMSGVENDVIPYGSVIGNRAHLAGLNIVGLKRRGFQRQQIHDLRHAYRLLFAEEGTMEERIEDVAQLYAANEVVMEIVNFIRKDSSRAICQPSKADRAA
jgi:UDP-N-acetylglucosamine acyltransferase